MACFKNDYCTIIRTANIAIGVVFVLLLLFLWFTVYVYVLFIIIMTSSIAIAVTEFWRLSLLLLGVDGVWACRVWGFDLE